MKRIRQRTIGQNSKEDLSVSEPQKLWIQRVGTDASMFDEYDLCRQSTSLIEWHFSISFRLERFNQLLLRQCRVGRKGSCHLVMKDWVDLHQRRPLLRPPICGLLSTTTFGNACMSHLQLSVLTWTINACPQLCAFDVPLSSILQPPKSFFVFFWVCAKLIKDLVSSGKLVCQADPHFMVCLDTL
jgi:hypothetical protein